MNSRLDLPSHLETSARQWRQRKRAELREVRQVLREFQYGCAYTPVYGQFKYLTQVLDRMTNALSVKNWGR